ncbi:TrmB family transcriptional regulator [Patescibacteria group bacterium]|nr:TrmB family transcriptional regulator [Patescibacteria group bacterium]
MSKIREILIKFGLADKEIAVYLSLLKLGPSPVRKVALEAGVNRGTTYDILKSLQEQGLVSYFHEEKRQYFIAEDPKALVDCLDNKKIKMDNLRTDLVALLPELKSIQYVMEERPVVKFYEGSQGVRTILQDVLDVMSTSQIAEYYVFSSADVKKYIYQAYPTFTEERIHLGIKVQAISLGSGGEETELSKRKWLPTNNSAPTYTLIYAGKVAMISINNEKKQPHGVIIEDKSLYQTQQMIFDSLWNKI